jgi:hypothetical protein
MLLLLYADVLYEKIQHDIECSRQDYRMLYLQYVRTSWFGVGLYRVCFLKFFGESLWARSIISSFRRVLAIEHRS